MPVTNHGLCYCTFSLLVLHFSLSSHCPLAQKGGEQVSRFLCTADGLISWYILFYPHFPNPSGIHTLIDFLLYSISAASASTILSLRSRLVAPPVRYWQDGSLSVFKQIVKAMIFHPGIYASREETTLVIFSMGQTCDTADITQMITFPIGHELMGANVIEYENAYLLCTGWHSLTVGLSEKIYVSLFKKGLWIAMCPPLVNTSWVAVEVAQVFIFLVFMTNGHRTSAIHVPQSQELSESLRIQC